MASIAKLFGDTKYADSIIECDGHRLLCHRAIVCCRSEILASEFDNEYQGTDRKPILHKLFDYYTLERMLQFIYEGDYTVNPASLQTEAGASNGTAATNGDTAEYAPPHLRQHSDHSRSTSAQPPCGQSSSAEKTIITNDMTAHVVVYGIAEHYKLPELKTVALKKFKEAKEHLNVEGFTGLARAVYRNTAAADDPLRKELLEMLMTKHGEWLGIDSFSGALADDVQLHPFAVAVVAALGKRSVEKSSKDKTATEAQATAGKLLLADLDQANKALAKSSNQIQALKSELKSAKLENTKLVAQVAEHARENECQATTKTQLQSTYDETNKKLVEAQRRAQSLTDELSSLQKDYKEAKAYGDKCWSQVKADQTKARETEEKLKKETARVNKNYGICNQKDVTIRNEKARADENAQQCQDWSTAVGRETAKADKGKRIIKSIVSMVNNTCTCKKCGEGLNFRLNRDDRVGTRSGKGPFNSLLKCGRCSYVEYGDYITD